MTTEQRLDRLEDEFDTVKQLLASAARYAESANRGLEQQRINLDNYIVESRLHRAQIEARMSTLEDRFNQFVEQAERDRRQAEIDRAQDRRQAEIDRAQVEARMSTLEDRFNQFVEQAERDRRQAEIDRAEFRSTVQQLLEVLTQRYNGNGN